MVEIKKRKMKNILWSWTEDLLIWGVIWLVVQITGVVMAVLIAFPTMLLWNLVIPSIFGLPTIDFFQAFALALLSSMLLSSVSSFLLLGLFVNFFNRNSA